MVPSSVEKPAFRSLRELNRLLGRFQCLLASHFRDCRDQCFDLWQSLAQPNRFASAIELNIYRLIRSVFFGEFQFAGYFAKSLLGVSDFDCNLCD